MSTRKSPFRGLLSQRIDPTKAPATGLNAQLGGPPSQQDLAKYILNEYRARWTEFDRQFGLEKKPNNWEGRAYTLAFLFIPGFLFKRPGRAKAGAPRKWTDLSLMQLFADVEYERLKTGSSVRKICEQNLRQAVYFPRWKLFKPEELRDGYRLAVRRKNEPTLFFLDLFGPEAPMVHRKLPLIECAIKRHALKANPRPVKISLKS